MAVLHESDRRAVLSDGDQRASGQSRRTLLLDPGHDLSYGRMVTTVPPPRGSGSYPWGVGPEARRPRPERRFPVVIEDARTNLQQQMGAALAPLPLVFFHHALADPLVDGGCDKARAAALAVVIAHTIVRNTTRIMGDIRGELLYGLQELPCGAIAPGRPGHLAVSLHGLAHLEGLVDLARSEKPL